jgi:aminoglycoside phosphotransferase (APT) family kinase protein
VLHRRKAVTLSGFIQAHTPRWLRHFASTGYPDVEPLAAGVEGAIYRLGNGTVAKVWGRRREPELAAMQRFYADVAGADLPFATPLIYAVQEVDGVAVTFERELSGEPLQARLSIQDRDLDPATVDCLTTVLRALATVPCTDAMRRLAVLDENRPFWAGATDFTTALTALLDRRVARFGPLLRAHVPDFDLRVARLTQQLAAVPPMPPTVIHGDLFGENILVDHAMRPTAVLDFGFLTTGGDPRLDAGISAAIMNMYGPHAANITRTLTAHLADALQYPQETLVLYQAAYAVATSNAFTDDGSDGHFTWCLARLTSAEVTAQLGL